MPNTASDLLNKLKADGKEYVARLENYRQTLEVWPTDDLAGPANVKSGELEKNWQMTYGFDKRGNVNEGAKFKEALAMLPEVQRKCNWEARLNECITSTLNARRQFQETLAVLAMFDNTAQTGLNNFRSAEGPFDIEAIDMMIKRVQHVLEYFEPIRQKARGTEHEPPGQAWSDAEKVSWKEVNLHFLSEFSFQPLIRGKPGEKVGFADLGLSDRRGGGDKPSKAWTFLIELVTGRVLAEHVSGNQATQKRAQELRNALRKHFRISDNPLPFIKGSGYLPQFKASQVDDALNAPVAAEISAD